MPSHVNVKSLTNLVGGRWWGLPAEGRVQGRFCANRNLSVLKWLNTNILTNLQKMDGGFLFKLGVFIAAV